MEVVSNPEFLKQGNAVYDFNHPDKMVVGSTSERAKDCLRKVYHGLVKVYMPYLEVPWETAEMIKYANNAFLATKVSLINELANLCQKVGADVKEVARAVGMDQRIGAKFLNAGIGYGGSCFSKDVKALIALGREKKYSAKLLEEVELLNERQKEIFLPFILEKLAKVGGNKVTLWGLSFKPKTTDLRGATSLRLIEKLLAEGISLSVYDPLAMESVQAIFGETLHYAKNLEDSVLGSNMIVLVTEWDEFRNANLQDLGMKMKNKILLDGRNIYEPEEVKAFGFDYLGVGRE